MKSALRGTVGAVFACFAAITFSGPRVKVGADVLLESKLALFAHRRVGLITNQSGRIANGAYLADVLLSRGIELRALFGPEHGIRGTGEAGAPVSDTVDAKTGIPVYSLYGLRRKPSPAMLRDIDILVYDIQDVGVRCYTYISTLARCMEAAAEKGIPFVVLDRPDPLGGILVDGPVLPDSLRSFVGSFPIPVVYGLSPGELAKMANDEQWLSPGKVDLTVVPMEGWTRAMQWRDTGLEWVPPSPNIPFPETAVLYAATFCLEATNVSEGRGTGNPFGTIGAPFLGSGAITRLIEPAMFPGLRMGKAQFIPRASKYKDSSCTGVRLEISFSEAVRPVRLGIAILSALLKEYPASFLVNEKHLSQLLGDPDVLRLIAGGRSLDFITRRWMDALVRFREKASRYFIYPEH